MRVRIKSWFKGTFGNGSLDLKVVALMAACFIPSAILAWKGSNTFVFFAVYLGVALSVTAIGTALSFIASALGRKVRAGHMVLALNAVLHLALVCLCLYDTFLYRKTYQGFMTAISVVLIFPAQAAVFLYFWFWWIYGEEEGYERKTE